MERIKNWVKENGDGPIITFSVEYEKNESINKEKSMVQKIIREGYNVLELVHFFTIGSDEVRSWTIRRNTKAP